MGERSRTRAMVVARAFAARLTPRPRPRTPERILVAHNLLLGDILMLTPLLKKLRQRHPDADIGLLAKPEFVPLYASRPYGVRALAFHPRQSHTARALLRQERFDRAVVVGDNRYSWIAAALGARSIVAHAADAPWTKSWFVDEQRPYGGEGAWGDLVAQLEDGPPPSHYARGDWPAPEAGPFEAPSGPYAVLHVGASTPLKHWVPERWRVLAEALARDGLEPVWSAGRGEEHLVEAADPARRYRSLAGRLDLAQMWRLLANARLLVAPDTGVAHLGRVTWTPTVALFGPGSATLCARGDFWRDTPWRAVGVDPFPCRDQTILFRRDVAWVRRCGRSTRECERPRCMEAVAVDPVLAAIEELKGTA